MAGFSRVGHDAIKQVIWSSAQVSSLDCQIIDGFLLPALGKCGNERTMKAGRNDPCPCGSGKKYKKCCLPKDQLIPMAPPPIAEAPEPIADPVEDDWQEAETLDEVEAEEPGNIVDEPERPPLHKYPCPETKLPDLPPEQEKIIEDWWKETSPVYHERDADQMRSEERRVG